MADSTSIINRPRNFPTGCGPNAAKYRLASRRLPQNRLHQPLPETADVLSPGNSIQGRKRVQKPPETPNLAALGNKDRVENRVQAKENPNMRVLGSSNRVPRAVRDTPSRAIRLSSRESVLKLLNQFRERCEEIRRDRRVSRPELKAVPEFMELIIGHSKSIGPIQGVEIGDTFQSRAELVIAGIHGKENHGIEYTKPLNGRSFATCVVAKEGEGHYNKMNEPDVLQYGGEGGDVSRNRTKRSKKRKILKADQVMKQGNLALKNSIEAKNGVRVVRGVRDPHGKNRRFRYVYDGLYEVLDCRMLRGSEGNKLFQFDMRRIPGQKAIDWKKVLEEST